MLATERSQPMRVCAGAGPFSARWFGSAKGTSLKPSPISPASAYSVASQVDAIDGNTLRCSHAVGFPSAPSVALKYIAATEWNESNLMSSSRLQTTLIGFPVFFDKTAASTTKSGNDLRPNPPPSSVTFTVTSSFLIPTAAAIASCAPCGFCEGAQASTFPSLNTANAAG